MKHVKKVITRDGQVYLYLRKAGLPATKLRSPEPPAGSWEGSALQAEVKALIAAAEVTAPGTLADALRAYELRDADFRILADSTKYEYRRMMYEMADDFGHLPIGLFTPAFIQELRNLWAARGHRAANNRLQVLKNALLPALIAAGAQTDPFAMIAGVRRPRDAEEPHLLWRESVVEAVIERAIAERRFGLARAVAIARYIGPRRKDLTVITRAARQGGRFAYLAGKRRVQVDMPEDPAVTRWLDATPDTQPLSPWQASRKAAVRRTVTASITLVFNMDGKPYTDDGLGQALADVVRRMHQAGELDTDAYDLHGLRHTKGVELALSGCTDAEGAAILGHSSPHSFAQYRRQADRIRLSDNAADKVLQFRERTRNVKLTNKVTKKRKNPPPK